MNIHRSMVNFLDSSTLRAKDLHLLQTLYLIVICYMGLVLKLADYKVSVKEKRDLLKDPQIGKGIFSLISTVLPALISLLTKK